MKKEEIEKIKDLVATCITLQEIFSEEISKLRKLQATLSLDLVEVMNIIKTKELK